MKVARGNTIAKSILLFILLVIVVLGGLLWFDYIGFINSKSFFAPVYKMLGMAPQTSRSQTTVNGLVEADLDNDRFAKRLESLDIRTEELDKREADIKIAEESNLQIAQELTDRQNAQEEREKTFNLEQKKYDDRRVNIEQIVQNLEGMQPANAVKILAEMDDQDIIDVLRKAEEDHKEAGTSSMVAYWLSLMDEKRAAEIHRKMANKPLSIN